MEAHYEIIPDGYKNEEDWKVVHIYNEMYEYDNLWLVKGLAREGNKIFTKLSYVLIEGTGEQYMGDGNWEEMCEADQVREMREPSSSEMELM